MRIRGWSIDGFGLFRDFRVCELPAGLTVLYGANEAGKTTLLEFLRGVLFGFGQNGSGKPHYPPQRGGRHGGSVIITGPDGDYTIDRDADRCAPPRIIRPDGRVGSAEDLHELLGGVDEGLFRSVFAFSLVELQSFESLDLDEVRDRLFSAAIVGAGRSARSVLRHLGEQGAQLLAGRGAARVNGLVDELNELRPRLDAARRAAIGYAEFLGKVRRADAQVVQLQHDLADRRAARARDDVLAQLRPIWHDVTGARQALEALEPIDDLPADANARLAAARSEVGAARAVLDTLQEESEQMERQRAELVLDPAAMAVAGEVEELHDGLASYRHQVAKRPEALARLAEAERALAANLRRLGEDWDAARLAGCDSSAIDRDMVQGWREQLWRAGDRERQAEQALEKAIERRRILQRERDRVADDLSGMAVMVSEELDDRRRVLARLRANLEEMNAAQTHGEAKARLVQDRERAVKTVDSETYPSPPRWMLGMLWVLMVLAAATGWWRGSAGDIPGAVGFGLAGIAAGLAAYGIGRLRQWVNVREQQREAARRVLRSEAEEARRARDGDWHRAAELSEIIAADGAKLGLPRLPSFQVIEECDEGLKRQATARSQADALQARLAELTSVVRRAEEEEGGLADQLSAAREAAGAARRGWAAWKASGGLPEGLMPEEMRDWIAELHEAEVTLASRDAAREDAQRLEAVITTWEARAHAALVGAGESVAEGCSCGTLVDRLLELRQRVLRNEPQRLKLAALDEEVAERARRVSAAQAELRRCEGEWERALRAGGATDEREFERRWAVFQQRQRLRRVIEEGERSLADRLGRGASAGELRSALVEGPSGERTGDAETGEAEIEALEQQLCEAVERQYEARQACRALENSAEVPTLESERAGLMAELGRVVRQWRVLAVAQGLVVDTLEEFERTRQPAVLVEASRALSRVTGARYRRVMQDDSGRGLVVVDGDGRHKRVADDLSRGTTEQLYLSIRLGLATDFARRAVSMPLVMDDVLVNFDPPRTEAMAAELGRFAREHQVLFFTCHPTVREVLEEVGDAARVVEI